MPTHEPFEQFDLPRLPRFQLVVTVVKVADGMYIVMPPICRQLGDLDMSGQIAKVQGDHRFAGALRRVPYDTRIRGVQLTWGIRRHKFGEWIHSINPRKVREEYRDCLDDLAAEVTQFLDQATFGTLAKHMDPAPGPKAPFAAAEEQSAPSTVQTMRPVLRGVLHINCQSCGAPHRIDLDEDGVHIVLGQWNAHGDRPSE
jgi:P22_AR N-terminal domain